MSNSTSGYAVFSAAGRVVSCDTKSTHAGHTFVEIVLEIGFYNGNPLEFSCTFWDMTTGADLVGIGDTITVTGSIRCPLSTSGYRNPRLTGKTCVVLQKALAAPQPKAQLADLYDGDIPF